MSQAMNFSPYKPPRVRPLDAAIAILRLLRDPQDTTQVFRLTDALRGSSGVKPYQRFRESPVGARIIAERRHLINALADRAALAKLPDNSVGRRYLAFMAEENLTAEGLAEISSDAIASLANREEGARIFATRIRDMHDLYHVLAGYGRDELGEVCVLAFSYPQQKIRSFAVIATLGRRRIGQLLRQSKLKISGVAEAVREAALHGSQAAWLPGEDLELLLAEDIDVVRARLGIAPPTRYQAVLKQIAARTGAKVTTFSALRAQMVARQNDEREHCP